MRDRDFENHVENGGCCRFVCSNCPGRHFDQLNRLCSPNLLLVRRLIKYHDISLTAQLWRSHGGTVALRLNLAYTVTLTSRSIKISTRLWDDKYSVGWLGIPTVTLAFRHSWERYDQTSNFKSEKLRCCPGSGSAKLAESRIRTRVEHPLAYIACKEITL